MENGIYNCTQINDGVVPWVLTRNEYFNGDPLISEVKPGDIVYVSQGSSFQNTSWIQTFLGNGPNQSIIVGDDKIIFDIWAQG